MSKTERIIQQKSFDNFGVPNGPKIQDIYVSSPKAELPKLTRPENPNPKIPLPTSEQLEEKYNAEYWDR